MDKLLTAKEAAELLNIHKSTVYKWGDQHRLSFIDLGASYGRRCLRFCKPDIERIIEDSFVGEEK